MFVHLLVGTLLLALICFGIGMLAGGPDLVSRRRRARQQINPDPSPVIVAATTELPSSVPPVIKPKPISRADMQIEP